MDARIAAHRLGGLHQVIDLAVERD